MLPNYILPQRLAARSGLARIISSVYAVLDRCPSTHIRSRDLPEGGVLSGLALFASCLVLRLSRAGPTIDILSFGPCLHTVGTRPGLASMRFEGGGRARAILDRGGATQSAIHASGSRDASDAHLRAYQRPARRAHEVVRSSPHLAAAGPFRGLPTSRAKSL